MVVDVESGNQREFLCWFDWDLMGVSYGCCLEVKLSVLRRFGVGSKGWF